MARPKGCVSRNRICNLFLRSSRFYDERMGKEPNTIFKTAAEIDRFIQEREAEAAQLEPSSKQFEVLKKEIAQLRRDADAKRWTESAEFSPNGNKPPEDR